MPRSAGSGYEIVRPHYISETLPVTRLKDTNALAQNRKMEIKFAANCLSHKKQSHRTSTRFAGTELLFPEVSFVWKK